MRLFFQLVPLPVLHSSKDLVLYGWYICFARLCISLYSFIVLSRRIHSATLPFICFTSTPDRMGAGIPLSLVRIAMSNEKCAFHASAYPNHRKDTSSSIRSPEWCLCVCLFLKHFIISFGIFLFSIFDPFVSGRKPFVLFARITLDCNTIFANV